MEDNSRSNGSEKMGAIHRLLEAEGPNDEFLGIVQKRYGDREAEVERWTEGWCEREEILARKASESRSQRKSSGENRATISFLS